MDNKMSVLCVVVLTYVKPLHEIDAQIPAHVEWLKGYADGLFWLPGEKFRAQEA